MKRIIAKEARATLAAHIKWKRDSGRRENTFWALEPEWVSLLSKLRAWSMTGKDGKTRKGLSLAATQLFIKPREKVLIQEADILEPW